MSSEICLSQDDFYQSWLFAEPDFWQVGRYVYSGGFAIIMVLLASAMQGTAESHHTIYIALKYSLPSKGIFLTLFTLSVAILM